MSNIYLQVSEKNFRSQNFDFLGSKNLSPGQFLDHANIILQLANQRSGRKTLCGFFLFYFWKELWRFKVKVPMDFVEQKYKR